MAKKRTTTPDQPVADTSDLASARAGLDASIGAKEAAALIGKLTGLQHALIMSKVSQLEMYTELDRATERALAAIEDEGMRTAIAAIKAGYAAVLAATPDPLRAPRAAVRAAISARNAEGIAPALMQLQRALTEKKLPLTEVYTELRDAAAEAAPIVAGTPHEAPILSMQTNYASFLSLAEELEQRGTGPTRTEDMPAMTRPKG